MDDYSTLAWSVNLSHNTKIFFWTFAIAAILVGGPILLFNKPFVQPHIKSPLYVPPRGCPITKIKMLPMEMPRACAAKEYEFSEASKYGFVSFERGGDSKFYRIGNDIVQIICYHTGECVRGNIIAGAFYQ